MIDVMIDDNDVFGIANKQSRDDVRGDERQSQEMAKMAKRSMTVGIVLLIEEVDAQNGRCDLIFKRISLHHVVIFLAAS